MRRILIVASCLMLACSTVAKADLVDDFWTKVKGTTGITLNDGDSIRVIFTTSAQYTGLGNSRGVYEGTGSGDGKGYDQAFTGALTGTFTKGALGSTTALGTGDWQALVTTKADTGTPVSDWVTDVSSQFTATHVFNTNGDYLGTDSTILGGLNSGTTLGYDQSGDLKAAVGQGLAVWTGTSQAGGPAPADGNGPTVLGTFGGGVSDRGGFGNATSTSNWLYLASMLKTVGTTGANFDITHSIYMMSGDVTVVPEPSSILMWLGFSSMAGVLVWRRRRKS